MQDEEFINCQYGETSKLRHLKHAAVGFETVLFSYDYIFNLNTGIIECCDYLTADDENEKMYTKKHSRLARLDAEFRTKFKCMPPIQAVFDSVDKTFIFTYENHLQVNDKKIVFPETCCAKISPTSEFIAVTTGNKLKFLDIKNFKTIVEFDLREPLGQLAFSSDGMTVAVLGESKLIVMDTQ
jgi:hypothetical protein